MLAMTINIVIDASWGTANLAAGFFTASTWFITLGVYYLLFCTLRWLLFTRFRHDGDALTKRDLKIVRSCGFLLVTATLILSGIATLLLRGDVIIDYGEIATISLATFTFYSLISSIVGFVRSHHHENLLIATNCCTNLAIALVSLFTLEVAMLSTFSTAEDATFSFIMPVTTSTMVAVILVLLGLRVISRANRELRSCEREAIGRSF